MRRLDGLMLSKMLENGYANLCIHEAEINDMNIFPVADGDTGTNMRLTLEHGLRYASPTEEIGAYLKALANGVLLGARGNSGVILSQLIKGMYLELSRASVIGIGELRNAYIRAYKEAYRTVARPVEGTILTVTREGIENIRRQIDRDTQIETFFSMYIAEMKKSLAGTPDLLAVLKEAGVVDSGAAGYILITEGMLKALYGETIAKPESVTAVSGAAEQPHPSASDLDRFNENSSFDDGYCQEFLLQLMNGRKYQRKFDPEEFTRELNKLGTSLVVVQDAMRVKVHIHTFCPDKVIEYVRRYGEFLTFKLENMQLQHNEHIEKQKAKESPRLPLAAIPVVDGEALAEIFADLGCGNAIDGGTTMNVSAAEFLAKYEEVNADHLVVLPDNKNTVSAAEQAAKLYKGEKKITVLPSESVIAAYCAVAMDVADSTDTDYRVSQMRAGVEGTHVLCVTDSVRDYGKDDVNAHKGQPIALLDGVVIAAAERELDAILSGMRRLTECGEKETCLVFRGQGTEEEQADEVAGAISEEFGLDVSVLYGGQSLYRWMIGLL